jgi:hypothetical protein
MSTALHVLIALIAALNLRLIATVTLAAAGFERA